MFYSLSACRVKTGQKQSASLDKLGRLRLVHHESAPLYYCQTDTAPSSPQSAQSPHLLSDSALTSVPAWSRCDQVKDVRLSRQQIGLSGEGPVNLIGRDNQESNERRAVRGGEKLFTFGRCED